jgi:peroxiredoxin
MRRKAAGAAFAAALYLAFAPCGLRARAEDAAPPPDEQKARIEAAEKRLLEVGKVGPDFTLPLVGGGEVTLANLLKFGKAVLVGFFAIDPKRGGADMPKLEKLHEAVEGQGLTTIVISPADSAEDLAKFVESSKIQFQVAVDGKETNHAVTGVYRARMLPTYYLLDPDGKVLWRGIGWKEPELRTALEKAGLKPPPAEKPADAK